MPALDRLPPANAHIRPHPLSTTIPRCRADLKAPKSFSAINRKPESDRLLVTTGTPVSGIIATKEDVERFRESCGFLRSQWVHFTTLFEGSDLKRELRETTAPIFFGDLNRLFIEHLVLHICRLTDEAQTMGRKNLTAKFLIEHSDWSNAPDTLAKLKPISDSNS